MNTNINQILSVEQPDNLPDGKYATVEFGVRYFYSGDCVQNPCEYLWAGQQKWGSPDDNSITNPYHPYYPEQDTYGIIVNYVGGNGNPLLLSQYVELDLEMFAPFTAQLHTIATQGIKRNGARDFNFLTLWVCEIAQYFDDYGSTGEYDVVFDLVGAIPETLLQTMAQMIGGAK